MAGKPIEQILGEMCKLCVCIFAFISGYGTYISFRKHMVIKQRFLYCMKKIVKLISIYWLTIICFFVPIVCFFRKISITEIVNNLFLNSISLVHTGWYVAFYIKAMVCILLYSFIETERSWILDLIVCLGIPSILEVWKNGNMFSHYFPVFMLGYIFSKYQLYSIYEEKIHFKILKKALSIIFLLILLFIRLKEGDMIGPIAMITFIGPVICYVLAMILNIFVQIKYIKKMLSFLSKYCTWYWFLHAIFHSGILELQKIGYIPKIPVLIIIWVFLILTPIAIILQTIYNICIKGAFELIRQYK